MPAPTALQQKPELLAPTEAHSVPLPITDDEDLLIETDQVVTSTTTTTTSPVTTATHTSEPEDAVMRIDEEGRPRFPPASADTTSLRIQSRKIPVPPHRMTPLKSSWPKIYPPLVEHLQLQVRMNIKSRCVELRTSKHTTDTSALQKGEDFVRAFTLGFDVDDAIALLRLDDLYIETYVPHSLVRLRAIPDHLLGSKSKMSRLCRASILVAPLDE
jgi:RNA-binding protein PNO1